MRLPRNRPLTSTLIGLLVGMTIGGCVDQGASTSSETPSGQASQPASEGPSPTHAAPGANGLVAVAARGEFGWHVRAFDPVRGDEAWEAGADDVLELRWSPDGAWLAVVQRGTLRILSAEGQPEGTIESAMSASWSPDSRRLAIQMLDGLYLYELGSDALGEIGPDWWLDGAEWSPDGESILFTSLERPFDPTSPPVGEPWNRIYRVMLAEGNVQALTDEAYHGGLCWAPDGRSIALTKGDGMTFWTDGFVMDLAGGAMTAIGQVGWGRCPWSPDGSSLAIDTGSEVRVVTTSGQSASTRNPVASALPGELLTALGWSPDGQWVLLRRELASGMGTATVEAVRADGSATLALGDGSLVAWQPLTDR